MRVSARYGGPFGLQPWKYGLPSLMVLLHDLEAKKEKKKVYCSRRLFTLRKAKSVFLCGIELRVVSAPWIPSDMV